MTTLTTDDYPAVRAALNVSLTAANLPDATIALDLYAGAASRWLLRRDPLAAGRSGADALRVKEALILYCASLLAPALPQISAETHGDDTYRRQEVDVEQLAGRLAGRAQAAIDAVLTPQAPAPARPPMFGLARGRRGR